MISVYFKLIAAFVFCLTFVAAQKSISAEKTSQTPNDHAVHKLANSLRGVNTTGRHENILSVTTAPLHNIRKVLIDLSDRALIDGLDQFIVTVAGTGSISYNGDNIAATSALVSRVTGIKVGGTGDIYFGDLDNFRVRKVTVSTGMITTIAGTGTNSYNGDNIDATAAQLSFPIDVALDRSDNVCIADFYNYRIRKVTVSGGIITTIAGTGTNSYNGDKIPATTAHLSAPSGVAVDGSDNVYISDPFNNRIRKVTVSSGIITTIAGTGTFGYNFDDIPATSADLRDPYGIAVDGSDNVYFADFNNHRIRKVTASSGKITTIAGTGNNGYTGDNIDATTAQIWNPCGVGLDGSGNIYIADTNDNRIRKVTVSTGMITTIAGTGAAGYNEDNIAATFANLDHPRSVAIDGSGHVYIADFNNFRIRFLTSVSPTSSPTAAPTLSPTASPSATPSLSPTASPSDAPSVSPTTSPSATPSVSPTASPSAAPSVSPTSSPSALPSVSPTTSPSATPSVSPTTSPSAAPSVSPTASPSAAPSVSPTTSPSAAPSVSPTTSPSTAPSVSPTVSPSTTPSLLPTASPSAAPSVSPTTSPSAAPSVSPTASPSAAPSASPTASPSNAPSVSPTTSPSFVYMNPFCTDGRRPSMVSNNPLCKTWKPTFTDRTRSPLSRTAPRD